jgi:hypothetical protein
VRTRGELESDDDDDTEDSDDDDLLPPPLSLSEDEDEQQEEEEDSREERNGDAISVEDAIRLAARRLMGSESYLESVSVLLLEGTSLWTRVGEAEIIETLFDIFNVRSVRLARCGETGIVGFGETSGVVIDGGTDFFSISPVFDMCALSYANVVLPFGGKTISGTNTHTVAHACLRLSPFTTHTLRTVFLSRLSHSLSLFLSLFLSLALCRTLSHSLALSLSLSFSRLSHSLAFSLSLSRSLSTPPSIRTFAENVAQSRCPSFLARQV